jgi:hypothetical protein
MPVFAPVHVTTPPVIDGKLDDWQEIAATDAFTQSFPRDGAAPGEHTRLRVAYDDDNLYIAVECAQKAPPVVRLTRRDRETDGDRVSIDLDTTHDRRSAFHFQVSAAGTLVDGLRFDDTELSTDWDEVWRAEVAHTADGWTAELAIPMRILRLHDGVTTWGMQVRRWIGATGEEDTWAYAPRDAGGEVSRYGDLGPFDGLSPRGSLALVPFVLTRLVHADAATPSPYGNGPSGSAGVDLTWRPAPSLTLQGALYPDFGQVEADQIVINLSTTETEYPEKRPFFLQGSDLFATPIQLLYTRRIGRVPETSDAAPPATVLAAGKLLATAGPVDVGALSVATGEVATNGTLDAPSASHHVVRVRSTGHGITLGAIGTAQLQSDDSTKHPITGGMTECPTGALVAYGERCSHDAVTGGVDGAWRSPEGTYVISGQLAASQVTGGPPIQRPDGTVLSSGDAGLGGTLHVAKEGGWARAMVDYEGYSKRFDIDDLGYLARSNVHHLQVEGELFSAKPAGPFVEEKTRFETFFRRNLDGLVLPSGYQWNVGATGRGLWEIWMELHWRPAYFDDRELGDGRALQRSGRLGLEVEFSTDPRRSVVAGAWTSTHSLHSGWDHETDGWIKIRPRDNVELEFEPYLLFTRGEPRFVDGSDPAGARFARQDASSVGLTTRAIWTLQRDLTLQAYVQALLASIRYRDAFTADPSLRIISLDSLAPASFDPSMYDGREGALNATIVARWEYRPGSTAFLVYSHAQTPADGMGFHPGALVHGPAADALLFKLSWAWLR